MIHLYSFRRCPYAMRARWALYLSSISHQIIEVDLKQKPKHLLEISPKGTVPVLFSKDWVLDESFEIVRWVFTKSLPAGFKDLSFDDVVANQYMQDLHQIFIPSLNRYKYAVRYQSVDIASEQAKMLAYLLQFEDIGKGLLGPMTWLDCICLPLIRQAYLVDKHWSNTWPQPLQDWLNYHLVSDGFSQIMSKAYVGVEPMQ
ncbi:glutathione S-transferase N-terminal domain-containing protein [Gammaproteobacteria bacterium]|nr:glutathione S-transferase N-terminal domain-containing protein [Gammaproteobacteria bacterium]